MNPAHEDGCTWWPDLWYRPCCDAHDLVYATDTVTWWSHIELGACVVTSAPEGVGLVAVIVGGLMAAATTAWWAVKHRLPQWFSRHN